MDLFSTGLFHLFIKILTSILSSPRSLEACKRQGINPSELTKRTFAEIKEMYRDRGFDREGYELMAKHYESRRQEKVKVLLDVIKSYFENNL